MNISIIIFWGFAATVVLTIIMAASKPLGLTRMDIPFLLGTLFTSDRNKAPWFGFLIHLLLGWIFALIYSLAFDLTGLKTWWFGMLIGFVQSAFVLSVGLQLVGTFHPRMAQPFQGPTPTRQLEPPGFFALNYGKGTPIVTIVAHLVFGAILGTFYH
jgi:hypothetical protein